MIYPAGLAVGLAALGVPLTAVLAAAAPQYWTVGIGWAALVAGLCLVDLLFLRRQPELSLSAPAHAEVGSEMPAELSARLPAGAGADAGANRDEMEMALSAESKFDIGPLRQDRQPESAGEGGSKRSGYDLVTGRWTLVPRRRGPGAIGPAWVRRRGPLRLMWRQARTRGDVTVGITEDISALRTPAIQAMLREADAGMTARLLSGEGSEFQSLVEYRSGMDKRAIDWKRSARHADLVAREFRTERNNQIVFAIDCGRAMVEPLAGVPRVDRAVSAALTCAYAALKNGDRAMIYAFSSRPREASAFVSGAGRFAALQTAASRIDYSHEETNFTYGLTALAAKLVRRSMIVVFSDLADPTSAGQFVEVAGRLLKRHLLLFVTWQDEDLEDAIDARPEDVDTISRAVTAAALRRERQLVLSRLRHLGVEVIEGSHRTTPARTVDAYLRVKQRGAL